MRPDHVATTATRTVAKGALYLNAHQGNPATSVAANLDLALNMKLEPILFYNSSL